MLCRKETRCMAVIVDLDQTSVVEAADLGLLSAHVSCVVILIFWIPSSLLWSQTSIQIRFGHLAAILLQPLFALNKTCTEQKKKNTKKNPRKKKNYQRSLVFFLTKTHWNCKIFGKNIIDMHKSGCSNVEYLLISVFLSKILLQVLSCWFVFWAF